MKIFLIVTGVSMTGELPDEVDIDRVLFGQSKFMLSDVVVGDHQVKQLMVRTADVSVIGPWTPPKLKVEAKTKSRQVS